MHQQFNAQFITTRLKPFLKRIMIAVVKKESGSEAVREFFVSKAVSTDVMTFFHNKFFNAQSENATVPFSGDSAEDIKDRENFLKHFVESLHGHKLHEVQHDLGGLKDFLPIVTAAGEVKWPPLADNKFQRLCQDIASKFEHDQIKTLIKTHPETAKKDETLLNAGKLLLVKDENGNFSKYIRATEYNPTESHILFYPAIGSAYSGASEVPVTVAPVTAAPATSGEVTSSGEDVRRSFQEHRAEAVMQTLVALGFVAVGDPSIDATQATAKMKSGDQTVLVNMNLDGAPTAPLMVGFTFQDGAAADQPDGQPLVGQTFSVPDDKLEEEFAKKTANSPRTAAEIHRDKHRAVSPTGSSKTPSTQTAGLPARGMSYSIGTATGGPGFQGPPGNSSQTASATGLQTSGGTTRPLASPQAQGRGSVPLAPAKQFTPVQNRATPESLAAKTDAAQNPQAAGQPQDQGAEPQGQPTGGPRRAGTEATSAPKPKSFFKKYMAPITFSAVTGVGGVSAIAGSFFAGSAFKGSGLMGFKAIKEVWLALSNFFPHIFS